MRNVINITILSLALLATSGAKADEPNICEIPYEILHQVKSAKDFKSRCPKGEYSKQGNIHFCNLGDIGEFGVEMSTGIYVDSDGLVTQGVVLLGNMNPATAAFAVLACEDAYGERYETRQEGEKAIHFTWNRPLFKLEAAYFVESERVIIAATRKVRKL